MRRTLRRLLAPLAAACLLAGCTTSRSPEPAAPAVSAAPRPPGTAGPRNAVVLLSGGGTPLSNNYSQYLQAKGIATSLARRFPDEPSWIFFGVGNREGEKPLLADARRQVRRDGRLLESWVPGALARNRPATRDSFLRALREEILPTVRDGGTLYLFVGDHGTVTRGKTPESEITLWQLKRRNNRGDAWFTDNKENLGVAELRQVLAEGIGRGRVVFVMTQCHSGGFHFLGVPREVTPPAAWFTTVPDWAVRRPAPPPLRAAGFTATDEQSIAAGCDPDPDPETWVGYERFLPEALFGLDLFHLRSTGPGLSSLAEAHEAATLVDRTIDKPRSSSEQYLERWASVIEHLGRESRITLTTAAAVDTYRRAVDAGRVAATDSALLEKQRQFQRYVTQLAGQDPSLRETLGSGNRAKLEAAINPGVSRQGPPAGGRPNRGSGEEARKAWKEVVRPAWKAAVLAGRVPGLAGAALRFERELLELEDQGRDFLLARGGQNTLLNELYWRSGYADPAKLDPAKAEAVTRWGAERREKVTAWARASADEAVRQGIATMFPARPPRSVPAPAPKREGESARPLSPRTAAERTLFYRRTLAAWEFLLTMGHREALGELQALIDLERTPLP